MSVIETLPNFLTLERIYTPEITQPPNKKILTELTNLAGIAGENGQGCMLVASCYIKDYFGIPLPPASQIWGDFRKDFNEILDPKLLNVPHEKFGEAFKKFEKWGIKLKSYRLNRIADSLIGESMKDFGPPEKPELLTKNAPLSVDGTALPFCVLLQQAGSCSTHILAIDGGEATRNILDNFRDKKYRIIGIFSFEAK